MNKKMKIAVSGPGLIGRQHVRLIMQNRNCELAAIIAPNSQENQEFCQSLSVPFFSDYADAIENLDLDGVIISSPNKFHYEQALLSLRKGVPTLVEKPLTDDLATAKLLVEAAELTGVPLLVGHHRTYSPLVNVVLDFLNSSRFGELVCLNGSALFLKPDHYFEDGPWRKSKGGGPILINLIHEIGLMRTFGGEIKTVQALASHNQRKFEVEDTVAIMLEFETGALGSFVLSDAAASSKSWEMTAGENSAYPFFPNEYCYHLAGTMGSIDFPTMAMRWYSNNEARSWWKPFEEDRLLVNRADPLGRQFDHFLDVIKGVETPRVSARDGYENLRVLEAVNKAIQTKSAVSIKDISSAGGVRAVSRDC